MNEFTYPTPTNEDYWRSIILYGQNTASFKFALGKTLLDFARLGTDFVALEDLAEPYANHICEHLKRADTQTTAPSSGYLDTCRRSNAGEANKSELIDATLSLGFRYVIDAFHWVSGYETNIRFFDDERKGLSPGLRLTDELLGLPEDVQFFDLVRGTEARWRLVEAAWSVGVRADLLDVSHDSSTGLLVVNRRIPTADFKEATIGYQRHRCFYCRTPIETKPADSRTSLTEADHVLPFSTFRETFIKENLDRVWNLVCACVDCNRDKRDRIPAKRFLVRLEAHHRKIMASNRPLREAFVRQMGRTPEERHGFLSKIYYEACKVSSTTAQNAWEPASETPSVWYG